MKVKHLGLKKWDSNVFYPPLVWTQTQSASQCHAEARISMHFHFFASLHTISFAWEENLSLQGWRQSWQTGDTASVCGVKQAQPWVQYWSMSAQRFRPCQVNVSFPGLNWSSIRTLRQSWGLLKLYPLYSWWSFNALELNFCWHKLWILLFHNAFVTQSTPVL